MPTLLLPEAIDSTEVQPSLSDSGGNGRGGGVDNPDSNPFDHSPFDSARRTPLSVYRLFTWLAIIWITTLFVTPTLILDSHRTYSKDSAAVPLPRMESGHLGAHYFGAPDD